tara:strand:- start:129 stop:458 length:330 start_codon:yes stop_codon:yes gene_type:complete
MARTYQKHSAETDKIIRRGMNMRGANSQATAARKIRQDIFKATGVKYSQSSILNRYYSMVRGTEAMNTSKYRRMYNDHKMAFITSLIKECKEINIENISDERGILISFK